MTLTPDCELGVHISCRTATVVVHGIVIVRGGHCDCTCHQQGRRAPEESGPTPHPVRRR
ncbi:hypothetical protein ACF1BN_21125 [Streptomyces sp. NPDC014861]|uniref:hypothetical protein n=1 Tax=Streptomyces sp. NPDC014861 TaxID=3364923 RepID=UPI0036F96226